MRHINQNMIDSNIEVNPVGSKSATEKHLVLSTLNKTLSILGFAISLATLVVGGCRSLPRSYS